MKSESVETKEAYLKLLWKVYEKNLTKIWQILNEHQIEAILIKGWAISRFYDKPYMRGIGDYDIVVKPEDYAKCKKIFEGLTDFPIDFHHGLRHLDTLNLDKAFSNAYFVELDGEQIRVLSEEDHLRILCVHWLNDGGENKERLWDIFYAIKNRSSNFDWDKCLNVVIPKRRLWIIMVILLTEKYLNLDISDLPTDVKNEKLLDWLPKKLEKIWSRKYRFLPLVFVKDNYRLLLYQLWYRIPPNPIMAIVGVEGDFDSRNIFYYQFKYFLKRSIPSITLTLKTTYQQWFTKKKKK